MRAPLSLIVLAALLVACGYKGPLYLPSPEKPEAQNPAPQPAPENENKKPPSQ
jgi:predicted small lipoprotein YifL